MRQNHLNDTNRPRWQQKLPKSQNRMAAPDIQTARSAKDQKSGEALVSEIGPRARDRAVAQVFCGLWAREKMDRKRAGLDSWYF